MHKRIVWIALLILVVTGTWSFAGNSNNDPKAQIESALATLSGQLSMEARAKIGGDMKIEYGNMHDVYLDPRTNPENFVTNVNFAQLNKKMKDQMDKLGIKMKMASPETRERVLRMLHGQQQNPPAYVMLLNDKVYLSGFLVFKNDVNAIGTDARKADLQTLKNLGVLINKFDIAKDNEFSVQIPADKFGAVLNMDSIKKFRSARVMLPNLDLSIPEIGANTVWTRSVSPATGSGVVVGIVDDGLDLNHADFRIAVNNTRVQFLWDQTATSGTPPSGYTYGRECTKAQIDAGSCPETAECSSTSASGHGTFTAGVAAGNGATYRGVAYQSDIYYVKTTMTNQAIWDGIKYLKDKATAQGKPIAISMSLGSNYGPHDGFADLDWLVDQNYNANTTGLSIAFSAGNDGDNQLHADALVCPRPAGPAWWAATTTYQVGFPWYAPDFGYQTAPDLVLEYYYPANKNINVSWALPVYYDGATPFCNNQTAASWGTTVLTAGWVPELDNRFTNDAKPNVWGITYNVQKLGTNGVCDSFVGDVRNRAAKWISASMFRESDCTQKNNGHGTLTRCNTAITPGGCEYHLDNEAAPGTDYIYVVFRPAAPVDVWDRTATVSGCGSTDPHMTCANDLFHCLPCTDATCSAVATGPGWGYGWGTAPETACPSGVPGYGDFMAMYVLFDEKNPATTDAFGDGGCWSACGTAVTNCTGIAEVPSQQTELEGWLGSWVLGNFLTVGVTPPEDCVNYVMQGDSLQCVGDPASAHYAIAAAAYNTKLDGCMNTADTVGDRPLWSSTGPLRDGTPAASWSKPEISAPGNSIASANAACVTAPTCPVGSSPYQYRLESGTSFSAPHVAGTAALLFQCCPTLTLGQVQNLLDTNALDAGTAGFDTLWGWGKLRANAAYLDLLPAFLGITSATPVSSSQINLGWNAATVDECPTGASYNIHRVQGSCPFTPSLANRIATGVTTLTYNNTGLAAGTQYAYMVRAVEGNQCTDNNTSCLIATTLGGGFPGEIPQKGGLGTALTIAKSGTNVVLTWGAPGGTCAPTVYEVYRGTLPFTAYNHQSWTCSVPVGTPTYTGIQDTGSYYYLVVAATATMEGSYGKNSSAVERPVGAPQCSGVTQNLGSC